MLAALFALPLVACGIYYPISESGTGAMPEEGGAAGPWFRSTVDATLSWWLATHPTEAGALGVHDFDAQLDRVSKSDLASRGAGLKKQLFRLGAAVQGARSAEDRADAEVLELHLRAELHDLETVREWARNPGYYRGLLAEALYLPASQEYDTAERRLGSLSSRLEQVATFLQSARDNLEQPPRLFTEIAIEEFGGLGDLVKTGLPAAFETVKDAVLRRRFDEARTLAIEALSKFVEWLRQDLLPRSTGAFALGPEALAAKLRFEAGVEEPLEVLRERGYELLRKSQKELEALSGGRPLRELLQEAKRDHPTAAEVIPTAQGMLELLKRWSSGLLTLTADSGCRVQETPAFLRFRGFSFLDAPGPFEKTPFEALYSLTLPASNGSSEHQEQYLAFFNRPELLLISAHEAYPGHFAQRLALRKCPSRVRKTFVSATFVEGWAHYAEELVAEAGLAPQLKVVHRSLALLGICRYLVALELHTQGMTLEQGAAFFEKEAGLDPTLALRETSRAALDPLVLAYTLGKQQILELREAWRTQTGRTLREFHDELLSLGAPPLSVARRLMLEGR